MNLIRYAVVALLALTLTGCASAINTKNANYHATAANEAGKAGDWATARKEWAKALVNAQLVGATAQQLAVFNYEYGRALGVLCFWDEAEKYLSKAYELDLDTGGPEFMSLTELSRLKYDQKEYAKAAVYYERAIQAMDKAGAPRKAPIDFADILTEYTDTLYHTNRDADAKAIQERADDLRRNNPKGQSRTDRTPYGTQCKDTKD
jgi:tetratricopeptide (TPR) repeat protein